MALKDYWKPILGIGILVIVIVAIVVAATSGGDDPDPDPNRGENMTTMKMMTNEPDERMCKGNQIGELCVYFSPRNEKRTFAAAKEFCKNDLDAKLYEPRDEGTHEALLRGLRNDYGLDCMLWSGIEINGDELVYSSNSDPIKFDYGKKKSDGNCAMLNLENVDKTWEMSLCNRTRRFICQFE